LQELAERQSRVYQLRCTFNGINPEPTFDRATALHLYRIAQEAAANAAKHGLPKKISVSLTHDGHHCTLVIRDDGIGIPDPLPTGRGMGLAIMKYRADILGARFSIARAEPCGTMVTCMVPHKRSSSVERNR
jgi:signal transduction histidine kinase